MRTLCFCFCLVFLACSNTSSSTEALFEDADSLECEELWRVWVDYLDPYLNGRQDCTRNEDCVWVPSEAICGDTSIQTCGAAVASHWESDYQAAWSDGLAALCGVRTQPCNTAPLCSAEPRAVCFDGRCTIQ